MDKHVSDRKITITYSGCIAAMVIVAVAVFTIMRCYLFLPGWIVWEEKTVDAGNGISIVLADRAAGICVDGGEVQRIGGGIRVQDVLVTDLDRDGDNEMILLCWRRGRYGSARPFWVKENPTDWSQHIFIYDLHPDGTVTNKWFSSDNGTDIRRFKVTEKNPQILLMEDVEGKCSLWQWQSWGLKSLKNEVRFLAFGDNLIHDTIYEYAERDQDGNFDFLYEDMAPEISSADLAALQLESILVEDPGQVSSYPYFGSPMAVGEAICHAGFDIVSCAGNHAADKGITGIDATEAFFSERNIAALGIQNSTEKEYVPCRYVSRNGIRFAFFDYTYGTTIDMREKYPYALHYLEEAQIRRDLTETDADFKVVFVHWGTEYAGTPDAEQLRYAQLFAELGADVVIGTHPHVIQEARILSGPDGHETLVAYSLGNFRAQQGFAEQTMIGGELVFTVEHCWDGVRLRDWELREFRVPSYR